jgi:transcription termination factor Rho
MPSRDAIFDEFDTTGNYEEAYQQIQREYRIYLPSNNRRRPTRRRPTSKPKPKRKLSAWNKFVKANSRKKEFRYRDGKLNLKKMGVAFRRKKRR